MSITAIDLLQFLDVSEVTLLNAHRELTVRLASIYDCEVMVGLSCPNSDNGESPTFSTYDSRDDSSGITDISSLEAISRVPGFPYSRLIPLPEFSDGFHDIPIAVVHLTKDIGAEGIVELELAVTEFFRRVADSICREIRTSLIVAKINSNDIGSFFHRLITEQGIQTVVASAYISVFVRDWIGDLLRLKGHNGALRSARKIADVVFHCEDRSKRVVMAHLQGVPLVEYSSHGDLDMSGVSMEADRGWSRVYWPIRLSKKTEATISRSPSHNNDGVVRLTNCGAGDPPYQPYTWLHLSVISFLAEDLYNILDSFAAAEEASFKKDEAFHNSMSVIDTIIRNIETVSDTIYDPSRPRNPLRPPRFRLVPLHDNPHIPQERMFQLLRTAYASAKDIGFQVVRANDEVPFAKDETTKLLVKDVILRAIDLVPDMCVAHSAQNGFSVPSTHKLLSNPNGLPPAVRGAPEALISVFANIFENSVKYRQPDRKVRIDVNIKFDDAFVWISVRDFGVGIKHDDEHRLFNRGYRGTNAYEYAPRGSGLGLNWCEKVLSLYGGSISAHRQEPGLEILIQLVRANDQ